MTPLDLQTLQSSHKNDYRYYQIEKHGSKFTNIAHSHVIPAVAILGISVYQSLKYKNMFSLEKLPQLLAPMSAGYIGERVIEFLGKREERNAKDNSTNNYSILKNCFEILEKESNIGEEDFLEQYHQKTNSDLAIYETINKIIFEKNDNFILPKKINRESELNVSLLKKSEEEAEIAQLTRMKIEAELAEKDIIKIFKFETYNQATVVKAFYGWEDYTKEKAAAVASKIKEGNIKESAILYGAPGCGKTSYVENVTKAIATKLRQDVIFYNIKNADLKTKTQNSATAHINQLFDQVFKKAETVPVVVFFDEFDGISTKRESIEQENHNKIDHQNNDVNALLLQKIEEAAGKKNILIFAATNHIENMDDALIRTGRFDYRIHIGKPNVEMRTEIIKTIFKEATEKELNLLLQLTSNQTTAEVAKTVNLFLNFKREKNKIEEEEIELFAKHTIQAQNSRQEKHIDASKINEWIEKTKEENSIQKLIETEKKILKLFRFKRSRTKKSILH